MNLMQTFFKGCAVMTLLAVFGWTSGCAEPGKTAAKTETEKTEGKTEAKTDSSATAEAGSTQNDADAKLPSEQDTDDKEE